MNNSFTITKFIRAKRDRVYEAWANKEIMKKWDCPSHVEQHSLEQNVITGGTYRNSMIDQGEIVTVYGTYLEVIPNVKIRFTSQWEGEKVPATIVTVLFADKNDGTEITLTQEGFDTEGATQGHEQGWASCLAKLENMAPTILSDEALNISQDPKMITIADWHYVGMSLDHNVHTSAQGDNPIPQLWNEFSQREGEIKNKNDVMLGVSGPIRDGGIAFYAAAVRVSKIDAVPRGMVSGTVSKGKYAEFLHRGPISSFGLTVSYIHNDWMPQAGYKDHDCSQIEVYPTGVDVMAVDFELRVLVPLE